MYICGRIHYEQTVTSKVDHIDTRYNEGIEIEVDTAEEERRKHLALIACSALIRNCLEEGLYPSWDAQNMDSVRLAEKLGYEFDHEYVAYEIE